MTWRSSMSLMTLFCETMIGSCDLLLLHNMLVMGRRKWSCRNTPSISIDMSTVDNSTKYDRPEAMVLIGDTRPASSCLWFIIAVKQTQTIESKFLWLLCEVRLSQCLWFVCESLCVIQWTSFYSFYCKADPVDHDNHVVQQWVVATSLQCLKINFIDDLSRPFPPLDITWTVKGLL